MNHLDRRSFIAAAAASLPALSAAAAAKARPAARGIRSGGAAGPVCISSGNGLPAVTRAMELLGQGGDPLDAVVEGVTLVEDDPRDMSVGYGGLPNEDGVVQLDSSVMHGPTHKAGAVGAIENIRNPARVALLVCRRTDHVIIVGDGARRFALAHGFKEEDLLTDESRRIWLRWKENLNPDDDWLDDDQRLGGRSDRGMQSMAERLGLPFHYGTIHCSAVDANGDIGSVTTTSGLSYKIPGRIGDSPIIGAGNFCDNGVGAAGATGRGEAVIQSCGAFQAVQHMANGDDPTAACLKVLKWIADHTRRRDLLDDQGRPNFGVVMYALRKDGAHGSACFRKTGRGAFYAVHDGTEARRAECAYLYQ